MAFFELILQLVAKPAVLSLAESQQRALLFVEEWKVGLTHVLQLVEFLKKPAVKGVQLRMLHESHPFVGKLCVMALGNIQLLWKRFVELGKRLREFDFLLANAFSVVSNLRFKVRELL